jgi:hypothetical protein
MKVKKNKNFITLEDAISNGYLSGMRVGFCLGQLPGRVAPTIAGMRTKKEIEKLLKKEINAIFKMIRRKF